MLCVFRRRDATRPVDALPFRFVRRWLQPAVELRLLVIHQFKRRRPAAAATASERQIRIS